MSWALRLLGVGSSQAVELGSASAVIERDDAPVLMIDCGHEALTAYLAHYGRAPSALFITHVHMDHVAGLERLFYKIYFDPALRGKVRLYVPAAIVPYLQARLADYPGVIAEGGANWWDGFQLVPVWTGDTRPIPEMLARHADAGELIAHDCALEGNPSHSGIVDLEREYAPELLARCVLYHYASHADGDALHARGHRVALAGQVLALADPVGVEVSP
jgi:glyoxylase-like metal-dependent hydrolase (beta-lactamase superfamily II)